MNNAIPYLVQKGDTLQSIANDLGIINGADLRHYHNMTSEPKDGIGPSVTPGKTLLTPPQEKIDEINAKRAAYDNARAAEKAKEEEQKNAVKQEEEKQQKKEEEKQKQAEESEHEGKYFVVHKALCVCNQAENPKQTAKLQVTSHKKVIFNGQEGQFTATDADKTFDPPVATFGKCKLQPSSSGYQPCTLSPAPKWNKPYNKSIIYGNKALTELSTLPCTIGGKVEVAKNGQTDSVMKEHAENTNPAALALLNPAVKMPVLKPAFPSVSSITLKAIQSDDNFSPVRSSKEKEVKRVMVRQNKECAFTAKIDKGNVNLTSWVIYEGFTGEKDKRLYTSEQIGSTFKNSFPALGKYRVEGYGKPKIEEGENAKNYKHYPDCSIDVEVTENKLNGTELEAIDGENFAKKISGKMRLRQNFPATFKAHFLMPPTEEELENLRMYVTDASGNVSKSVKVKNTVSFTPENSKALYKIEAEYKTSSGEIQTQHFTGETISNTVSAITHNATVIRRGTPMTFAIAKGTFSFFVPEEQTAIDREVNTVKWNLNGRLMGRGRSITLPGHEFTNLGKYVVEAYCTLANAYGANAKDEEDDWHFEVKDNDVESFSYIGNPKVGKTTQLEADRCVFPQTIGDEMIIWDTSIPHKTVDKKTISITPIRAGKQLVQCRINRQKGVTLSIDVKQAKILGMLFTDSGGIEIEKSKWFQTVNIWVKQEHLIGEDLTIEIWDKDKMSADDYCKVINVKEYDGNLIPLTLDSYIKSKAGDWGSLYVKIGAPKLKLANPNNIFESTNRLDVQDKREIYSAQIGTQDGKERHYHVDYNQISFFYGKSRGIKAGEKLKITIYENGKVLFEIPASDISVDESGKILAKVKWDSIAVKLSMRTAYAVVEDAQNIILYNGAKTANGGVAVTKSSALLGLAEYKSAVLVGKAKTNSGKDNKNGVCEAEARVRAFMRMLRVKEDTVGDSGYEKIVGGKSFIKDYNKDWSTHPKIDVYIKRIDNSSNAAGAYQFMGRTYDEIIKNYGKRYQIMDFNKEAQDKMCLVLMKHYYTKDRPMEFYDVQPESKKEWRKRFKGQQGDIIQYIIDDDIKKAALLSSLCWASLPDSPYGQQSSSYTFADVRKIYDNFLKDELIGKSDLYLKKGFLKKFGYLCCDDQSAIEKGSCDKCNQDHYDVAKPEYWVHQKTRECWQASIEILANYGLKNNSGYPHNRIIVADQSGNKLISKEIKKGMDYIDSQLKEGNPVVVGLDDNLRQTTYNSHKATEHFFVIVGKGCVDGKRFYRFFDVGAHSRELGTGKNSRLFLLDNGMLQGKSAGGSHTYTVTEVRRNN